jgi:TPR repeat protein
MLCAREVRGVESVPDAKYKLASIADQHFARAYYNLGILYLEGQGVRQDYKEAFRWFQKGAEAGDSSAQTNLGYMYDQGLTARMP